MRFWKLLLPLLATTLSFAAQSDRIAGTLSSGQMVSLRGNMHGLAKSNLTRVASIATA